MLTKLRIKHPEDIKYQKISFPGAFRRRHSIEGLDTQLFFLEIYKQRGEYLILSELWKDYYGEQI